MNDKKDLEKKRNEALEVFQTLLKNGFEAWIVGGAARDTILHKIPEDYDIATHCPHSILRRLFKNRKVKSVGKLFQVTLVDGIEISTYRKGDGPRLPLTRALFEDLSRRDLTINAIALNPITGETVDYFGGVDDLKAGLIRFTGDPEKRIIEDPLRMVRACRFKARLNGQFHEETIAAIHRLKMLLPEKIAPERIRLEILKAMRLHSPSLFFNALLETGLLPFIFPSLVACVDTDGGPFHGETVWEHLLLTGDALPAREPLLRLAGYLHDVGKPISITINAGRTSFYGHEEKGASRIMEELCRLRFSRTEREHVVNLIRHHMRDLSPLSTPKSVRRFLKLLSDHDLKVADWLRLKIADRRSNLKKAPYRMSEIKKILKMISQEIEGSTKGGTFQLKTLAVNGHDVMTVTGLPPGKEVARLLEALLYTVIDEPALNTRETLLERLVQKTGGLETREEEWKADPETKWSGSG